MADPKLQIDRRLDNIELAITTLTRTLEQAQIGFGSSDSEVIEGILRGKKPVEPEDNVDS